MTTMKARPDTLILFFSSLLLLCVCLIVPLTANLPDSQAALHLTICATVCLVLFFLYRVSSNKGFITPLGFFILSLMVFIMARPYLYIFFGMDVVETGNRITFYNILLTISHVAAGLSLIVFGYLVFRPEKLKIPYITYADFRLNKILTKIILILSIFLLTLFLKQSYSNFLVLQNISYAAAFELGTFHSHLAYFFLAKQLMLLWVFFSGNRNNFLLGSLILFVGSIGFILIGLRGYTIAYLFLFLYFLNEKKKINIFFLSFITLALIYIAALVLEFRVGFKIFDSVWEIIPKTLHQQGASFEVVFGSTIFPDELESCINLLEYFSNKDFGLCVDQARGLNWEFGGFASSFFAEAIYLGYPAYICICLALGFCVKYLDVLSRIRRDALKKGRSSKFIGLILFATIPNLVYFGRSSAFDLIIKVITISFILIIFAAMFSKNTKANA